eukprot:360127-Chlamydomonas_euryale.AAC.3
MRVPQGAAADSSWRAVPLGFQCAQFTPPIYNDLLQSGDGSAEWVPGRQLSRFGGARFATHRPLACFVRSARTRLHNSIPLGGLLGPLGGPLRGLLQPAGSPANRMCRAGASRVASVLVSNCHKLTL